MLHEGQPVVDYVGRFENLESDFSLRLSANRNPVSLAESQPNEKARLSGATTTDATRELVATTFASDVKRFGYSFG